MANPGLTFNTIVVNGLVEEVRWGQWASDEQEAHCFGNEGTSSIQGALVKRDLDVPIILSGYGTQLLLEAAVLTLEKLAGSMGALQIRVGGGTPIFNQAANVKLMSVQRGRSGNDAVHGFWRYLMVAFRQLASS